MKVRVVMAVCACCAVAVLTAQQSSLVNPYEIDKLIQALYREPWQGAESYCSPLCWDFHFTPPMRALLEIGQEAQTRLLLMLPQVAIRDQVIILLGGVGDERAVAPIIDAMNAVASDPVSEQRRKTLLAGNLALTNITVADVIWHHGGGITFPKCTDDPGACWATWWKQNRATFRVSAINQSRRYSNYPNYGIYRNLP